MFVSDPSISWILQGSLCLDSSCLFTESMATRNRTASFLKYRDAVRHANPSEPSDSHSEISVSSKGATRGGYVQLELSESVGESGSSAVLPPVWVDLSEKVKEEMQRARSKMGELAKAQARALLPNFDTSKNTHEENIELLTQEITRILKRCEKFLQRLTQDLRPDENSSICKNVQRSMATDLQSLSMDFRKQSKAYLQRLEQQQEKPTVSKSSKQTTDPEDDDLFDPGFNESQLLRVKRLENVSAAREQEVHEIIGAVNELAQMMKDLSVLVIDQGTVVDRIDYNIQTVSVNVEKGVNQLKKAQEKQKRNAMLYCIMLLIVMCLVMLLILVLKKLLF